MQGDCLERMKEIPDGSVDMILTDPPYGTTACKWDSIIPLEPMWEQLKRVIKPNGAIVMTASQPFTTTLISSNMKMFKYCWVWDKKKGGNIQVLKWQPYKIHEDVVVFSNDKHPKSILEVSNANQKGKVHPTQKPVALMEYLIKTYTNESETVLDFTMGSGSTGVAAKNLNRKFIGIEMDEAYFNIAKERIAQA
jgi:site-specific DNA-methyltransferase (adenine-specific)